MILHTLTYPEPFELEAGGILPTLTIAYHTSDDHYDGTKPVVWVCHALTANSDAEDWWPEMVGPGKAIDTDRYFVACVNMIGSPYGSTSPISTNPDTGRPYLLDFPKITVRDMVRANSLVRRALGIEHIDLLVGSSIGGFQAIEWSITEPEVIRKALFIATGVRINAWISATFEAQRMALEADSSFRLALDSDGGKAGLRCARAQALLTYRSFDGYCLTQSETDIDTLFPTRAASYERYQGDKLIRRFDAYSYLSVIDSADSHNVGRGRGGVAAALSKIQARTVCICITSDGLFPPSEMSDWARHIPGAQYIEIESRFGHDGFLLETESLTQIIHQLI